MKKPERHKKRAVSFVDACVAENPQCVHKLKAKDSTGRWAYYVVFVRPHAEKAFLAALKAEKSIDLEDFGLIIGSCYGDGPDRSMIERLQQKYGFDVN